MAWIPGSSPHGVGHDEHRESSHACLGSLLCMCTILMGSHYALVVHMISYGVLGSLGDLGHALYGVTQYRQHSSCNGMVSTSPSMRAEQYDGSDG
jgi:hypothetical protein